MQSLNLNPMQTEFKLEPKVREEIIRRALEHIKKVESNPEVKTDGDNFDYWGSVKLDDGNYVDFNLYCGDDVGENNLEGAFEYGDPSEWSWTCSAYAVDPPTENNKYHSINTNCEEYLFHYNNGKVNYE